MLKDSIIDDVFTFRAMRGHFQELEGDNEAEVIKGEVLKKISDEDKKEIEDLLDHLEYNMMERAYKKGLQEGMLFALDLTEKPAAIKQLTQDVI